MNSKIQNNIAETNLWWFNMLDQSIFNLADLPSNVISRIGSGKIAVGEDIAQDFDFYLGLIVKNYDDYLIGNYYEKIKSINSALCLICDWSNESFINDDDWNKIRFIARDALLGKFIN